MVLRGLAACYLLVLLSNAHAQSLAGLRFSAVTFCVLLSISISLSDSLGAVWAMNMCGASVITFHYVVLYSHIAVELLNVFLVLFQH
jgi:hypothetical protein